MIGRLFLTFALMGALVRPCWSQEKTAGKKTPPKIAAPVLFNTAEADAMCGAASFSAGQPVESIGGGLAGSSQFRSHHRGDR